jgi:hypothetical protein
MPKHTQTVLSFRRLALAAVSLAGLLSCPQFASAEAGGPFAKFIGNWRGSGTVQSKSAGRERINCRADYSSSEGGEGLTQNLVCAGDSYKFEVHAYVIASGSSAEGNWQESTRQVSGHLTGRVSDGQFEGVVSGPFTASIGIRSTGRGQAVSITPRGTDITSVEVTLTRAR